MPLSPLTRLRAAIIVIGFALTLFCLDASQQAMVYGAALFVLPVLIWLLVSNAVKEAPPFDDKAFHRTRPVTAGQVFRHLAGFHLLVLASLLVVLLAYTWRMNLGWREVVFGVLLLGIPWIALVSLFGAVASLSTSTKHWKGWGFVTLLLLPATSVIGLIWASTNEKYDAPNLLGVPFMAVIIYPALWWLVAAKGRWTLGCLLGMVAGIGIPWGISSIETPDFTEYLHMNPQKAEVTIQRLKSYADAKGMMENQASVSRLLKVHGLAANEFIGGISILKLKNQEETFIDGAFESDRNLGDMEGTAFSADATGLLIPSTASLLNAIGLENAEKGGYPVWGNYSSEVTGARLAEFLSPGLRLRSYPNRWSAKETFDSAEHIWMMAGSVYEWQKVLDTTAKEGGRMKHPNGGIVEMDPVDTRRGVFEITVRCINGNYQATLELPGLKPVLVARGESGIRRFVEPNDHFGVRAPNQGILVREKEFLFQAALSKSQTDGQIKAVENMRLELYWPVFRGGFRVTLPPP